MYDNSDDLTYKIDCSDTSKWLKQVWEWSDLDKTEVHKAKACYEASYTFVFLIKGVTATYHLKPTKTSYPRSSLIICIILSFECKNGVDFSLKLTHVAGLVPLSHLLTSLQRV